MSGDTLRSASFLLKILIVSRGNLPPRDTKTPFRKSLNEK